MADDDRVVRRYRVFGRVQGVGFRYFVAREAERLGVQGWVRNRPDGSVEAVAETSLEIHEAFAAKLQSGPSWSRVSSVEYDIEEGELQQFSGFSIHRDG